MITKWDLWIPGPPPHFPVCFQYSTVSLRLLSCLCVCCPFWQWFEWQVSEEPAPSWGTKYQHLLLVFRTQNLKPLGLLIQSASHCHSMARVTSTPEEAALCPLTIFIEIVQKTPTNWLAKAYESLFLPNVFKIVMLNYAVVQIILALSSGVSPGSAFILLIHSSIFGLCYCLMSFQIDILGLFIPSCLWLDISKRNSRSFQKKRY